MRDIRNYYIKTNRIFNPIRKYTWLVTVVVAIGGLWFPKLGLVVLAIMAALIATAFFNGRFWCGNVCPHGSLFDRVIQPISRNGKIPAFFKTKTFVILFFLFFMWNLSRKVIKVASLWGTYEFLDRLGFVFVMTYLVVMVVGGLLAIIATPRTWCQFCPMGSIQKAAHKIGKLIGVAKKTEKKITIDAREKCHNCGKCARVCPFQLKPYLEFSDNHQFENPNCIKCTTCVANCPAGILSVKKESEALKLKSDAPSKGYENVSDIKARITEINTLGDGVNEYVFEFVSPEKVDIKAGRFILIKIMDDPKQYRAYSISAIGSNHRSLGVIIKKVDKGFGTSKIFEDFHIGDIIDLKGPMGDELVVDKNAEKVLFVANGIGITPFIELSKSVLECIPNLKSVKLLTGKRRKSELLYDAYFRSLENDGRFEYIPVVSRDKDSGLRNGYVTDILKEMDLEGYKVYMCGTKSMIIDSYRILLNKGIQKEDIHYESEERIDLEEK
jgi:NAD(P)H-flavin reductase/ferredoxin